MGYVVKRLCWAAAMVAVAGAVAVDSAHATEERTPTTTYASDWVGVYVRVLEEGTTFDAWVDNTPDRIGGQLRAEGKALAGKTLTFTTGGEFICTAVTVGSGQAWCDREASIAAASAILLNDGFDVSFDGDDDYLPSSGHADTGLPVSAP